MRPRRGRPRVASPPGEARRPRRVRGLGRGRALRRTLAEGGRGPGRRLNDALASWEGVQITPMFGRWGYFVDGRLFACFPLREKEHDLWVRLAPPDQSRALQAAGVRPHRRFGRRGWIELDVATAQDVSGALRWLRRAYTAARSAAGGDDDLGG